MSDPFFSIIIPTYNRASMLSKAIKSVFDQVLQSWELIIVDDGSTDNTSDMVAQFDEKRILYFFQENQGRSAARNKGIELSKGEYICFLDSDDYFLPGHLKSFSYSIERSIAEKAILINGLIVEKNGLRKKVLINDRNKGSLIFFFDNTIHSQQVCVHRSVFEKEKYNIDLSIGEDLELWLRISDKFPVIVNNHHSVVVVDHYDRSVNKSKFNPGFGQLQSYRKIFENNKNQNENIPISKQNELISNALASIGFHYYLNKQKGKSLKFLIFSIFKKPFHSQIKFRLYAFFSLLPLFSFFFKRDTVFESIS